MTEEEKIKGQQEIDSWFSNLPNEISFILKELEEKVSQMLTFDLLSYISFYNHIHDAKAYSDYREDKMFVVSELISLIALKKDFVANSHVDIVKGAAVVKEIQELGNRYLSKTSILEMKESNPEDDHSMAGIAFRARRDETSIRNPGQPEHHLMFSAELYASIDDEIKNKFGFSIAESIILREKIVKMLNTRYKKAIILAEEKGAIMAMEVFRYRSTKTIQENRLLSKETIETLNQLSRKQIRESCKNICLNEMYFYFSNVYCFTAEELSDFSGQSLATVTNFIKQLSCGFPSVKNDDSLISPVNILKTKPLIENAGKILVPSIPLLFWSVEPVIEDYIKSVKKLQDKFKEIKHDFLLKKGTELFNTILKGTVDIFTNLYYYPNDNKKGRCETDMIFRYERTIFIVEAKAQRISQAVKEGKIKRTETLLKEMVRDSYEQGLRTLEHIRSTPNADFLTGQNKRIEFRRQDFDEVILVSLTLEPIGNLTPLIRATNELGFFKNNIFPWIINLYDLQIITDHLEMPIFLLHYIKRRSEFLSKKVMHIFDEGDLLSYYLHNRLYIEGMHKQAMEKAANIVYLENGTDEINNYYMQKHQLENPDAPKVKMNLPELIKKMLTSLENSKFSHRQDIMMGLLDIPPKDIEDFINIIKKIKAMFFKDGKSHDCSILTELWGQKVGFTFVTSQYKLELDGKLYFFCQYKMNQLKTSAWVGIGDLERSPENFNLQSGLIAKAV